MKAKRPKQRVTEAQKAIKNGDPVIFTDDFGVEHQTKARTDAYQIKPGMSNEGMWVIFIEGKSGYWELDRMTPVLA
jgi:hypothetical protein